MDDTMHDLSNKDKIEVKKLFDKAPWVEARPGRHVKEVTYLGKTHKRYKYACQICQEDYPILCMIQDELWQRIAPNDGFMCFICMESQLGRQITESDLKDIPGNRELIYILRTRS